MACKYIRAFRVERLKLSLDAAAKSHGKPLPRDILLHVAGEHGVQEGWARRIERREDIDLDAYRRHRRQMTKIGVDPDESAGKRVAVGGKATRRNKKAEIKAYLSSLLGPDVLMINRREVAERFGFKVDPEFDDLLSMPASIDMREVAERFGLPERSNWPRMILSELEKERAAGEKRPVSAAQRDLVFDLLRQIGGNFGEPGEVTEHQKAVDLLLSRYSLAQIHKALKNLHHVVRMVRAMRSSFGVKVVKPLLDAIDFRLFRR